MNDKYVIDAAMSEDGMPYCYCPVEVDSEGSITCVITGMNCLGFIPKGGELIGVVHDDGKEAAENWCNRHSDWKIAHK